MQLAAGPPSQTPALSHNRALLSYVYTNPPPGTFIGESGEGATGLNCGEETPVTCHAGEHDVVYVVAASDAGAVPYAGGRRRDTDAEEEEAIAAAAVSGGAQ